MSGFCVFVLTFVIRSRNYWNHLAGKFISWINASYLLLIQEKYTVCSFMDLQQLIYKTKTPESPQLKTLDL